MLKYLSLIMICCMIHVSSASMGNSSTSIVQYTFNNTAETTPGGIRYDMVIGKDYSLQVLENTTSFIWNIFQQNPNERKNVQRVSLILAEMDGHSYTINDQILINERCPHEYRGNLKTEFTGVMYHENTHIWQWNGNEQAPRGLIEGIADFVRLKAGFASTRWVKPGEGDKWDHGYDITARFLDYCNDLGNGSFVAKLNKKMRSEYNDSFFEELLGKNVDTLWSDYKAKYGH